MPSNSVCRGLCLALCMFWSSGMFLAPWGGVFAQQELDRDADGLTDAQEALAGTDPSLPDSDGDGLLDGWEVVGFQAIGESEVEPLHLYGANPLVKDVFVEIDWMASADGEPATEATNALFVYQAAVDVTRAFRRSGTGIRVHFDLGPDILSRIPPGTRESDVDFSVFDVAPDREKILPYQDRFPARPSRAGGDSVPTGIADLYTVANDPRFFRASRRNLFYYVICAEQSASLEIGDGGDAAAFHPFVDDFSDEEAHRDGLMPSGSQVGVFYRRPIPAYNDPRRVRYHFGVSLFHELGHAFGLGHGGALAGNRWDNTNFKVNYLSIMNHRYQFWGVDTKDGVPVMDFSHGELSAVSELELFEPKGLGVAVSQHVLANLNVARVPDRAFPLNVDWNRDGRVTVSVVRNDLNQNGFIDAEVSVDHDDWGKLSREGFDGIGRRAFSGCGSACDLRTLSQCVPGDFNGDGLTDLFLATATRFRWNLGGEAGPRLFGAPGAALTALGESAPHRNQRFEVGDFLGVGRDSLLWQRPANLAVIEYAGRQPYVVTESAGEVSPASSSVGAWSLEGPPGRFLPLRLSGSGHQLVTTDGRDVAVLTIVETEDRETLAVSWRHSFVGETEPRVVNLQQGRTFSDGLQSVFVFGPRGTFEVRFSSAGFDETGVPVRPPTVRRMDVNGSIRPIEGATVEGATEAFPLHRTDTLLTVDLDGDRVEELVVLGNGRLALAGWTDNQLRLWWSAEETVAGWVLDEDWNRLYHAQLLTGGGEELVLSNGLVWITLAWTPEGVEVLAVNVGALDAGSFVPPGTELSLDTNQRVFPGKFVQGSPEGLLVFDGSVLALAAFDSNPREEGQELSVPMRGFRVQQWVESRADQWIFGDGDRFRRIQGDADPQAELLVQKGEFFGVLDLRPANRVASSFIRRLDAKELAFTEVTPFRRGDVNLDGAVDISDASRFLGFLFLGDGRLPCEDAADANDSGRLDLADTVFILSFLFLERVVPPQPGPDVAGMDPSLDALGCDGFRSNF